MTMANRESGRTPPGQGRGRRAGLARTSPARLGDAAARAEGRGEVSCSEVLILPDGRVLAHNVTPAFGDLLHALNPEEPHFAACEAASVGSTRPAGGQARGCVRPRSARFEAKPRG